MTVARWSLWMCRTLGVVAMILVSSGTLARADEVDEVNAIYKSVPDNRRSDLILLPLLAKMTPPPAGMGDPMRAALVSPATPGDAWKNAVAWATADPQKAIIEGLKKATSDESWKSAYAFAQPYGSNGIDPDLVTAGLYTELGDPPMLAAADFKYMPALNRLAALLQVEATRLAADGKINDAMDLMVRSLFFGRQMADREFQHEKQWGMGLMSLSFMRLRDLDYTDSRKPSPQFTAENASALLKRLRAGDGMIGLERINMPKADRLAARQVLERAMTSGGGPNKDTFADVMGKIESHDRPLRMFSETAKWESVRVLHANTADTMTELNGLYNDWSSRWERAIANPFDPLLKLPTDYAKMDRTKYAAVDALVTDPSWMFSMLEQLRVEAVGTRTSLALQGYVAAHQALPPIISAIRPQFVQEVEVDPFDPKHVANLVLVSGETAAHDVVVFPDLLGLKYSNFTWPAASGNGFVLYSVGPDGARNGITRATQMVRDDHGDYLVWPPVISLLRQNLQDTGKAP